MRVGQAHRRTGTRAAHARTHARVSSQSSAKIGPGARPGLARVLHPSPFARARTRGGWVAARTHAHVRGVPRARLQKSGQGASPRFCSFRHFCRTAGQDCRIGFSRMISRSLTRLARSCRPTILSSGFWHGFLFACDFADLALGPKLATKKLVFAENSKWARWPWRV